MYITNLTTKNHACYIVLCVYYAYCMLNNVFRILYTCIKNRLVMEYLHSQYTIYVQVL